MGKSKHIKDSQMILFFFNDFAFSETDGEWRAESERLGAQRKGEGKCNMLRDFIWTNYD